VVGVDPPSAHSWEPVVREKSDVELKKWVKFGKRALQMVHSVQGLFLENGVWVFASSRWHLSEDCVGTPKYQSDREKGGLGSLTSTSFC
jgi:hypothetical protein